MIYKRILLKLSGESLMGGRAYGIDEVRLGEYAKQIKEIADRGIEIGIVIGGGNIFRGLTGAAKGFDRVKGDQMGMLATVINSLALSSALEAFGVDADVLTAVRMEPVGTYYSPSRAAELMREGHVVLMAGGTGNPFFTTDTAAALRGIEIGGVRKTTGRSWSSTWTRLAISSACSQAKASAHASTCKPHPGADT